jgi:two-component system, OmpR family, response regulator
VRVLIVEDEVKLAALIRRGMREHGLRADVATTGENALWMAGATEYGAIVLDVMLTARDAIEDRVAGLDGGADDYLVKPFSFDELLARLRALARRTPAERPPVLAVGELRLDPAARRVWRGETEIELTPTEFALLEALMRRPGDALSRFELLELAWDGAYENRSNVVDVHVKALRDRIDRPFGAESIETVRGVGYRVRAP